MSLNPKHNYLAGSLWMVAGGLLFVAVAVTVRHLGSDLPAVEAAFIRYVFGLLILIPVILRMQWHRVKGANLKLYAWRGLAHGAAVMLWFYAMARIPISEVTAIGYTTPIFTVVGAVLIFGERVRSRRIISILIGFIGILIILRPGFETIEIGSLAQLVAAPCFAISFLFAKKLTNTENSSDTLVMLSVFCTLALMPGAIYLWRPPTVTELGWLALVAAFATAGHYAITKSIANAPLTVTQPFSFLQLVWAIIFGYLIFDEVPDFWVCVGAAIIVAAISYMSHREAIASRQQKLQSSSSMPT
jgi:drug/metabolite transporter (DMT)-like permease